MEYKIRRLETLDDFAAAAVAQKKIWGFGDGDTIPDHFMVAMKMYAEQWGVFKNEDLIALALIYPTHNHHFYLLHMLGVLPKARGQGFGYKLLHAVTETLKRKGIKGLFWTYDPFDFTNSHLYLNKICGVGIKVLMDYYGVLNSSHHGGLPSHRLFCFLSLGGNRLLPMNIRSKKKEVQLPVDFDGLKSINKSSAEDAKKISYDFFNNLNMLMAMGWLPVGFKNVRTEMNYKKGALVLQEIRGGKEWDCLMSGRIFSMT